MTDRQKFVCRLTLIVAVAVAALAITVTYVRVSARRDDGCEGVSWLHPGQSVTITCPATGGR